MRSATGSTLFVRARIATEIGVLCVVFGACREHRIPAEQRVDYRTDVQPILVERCAACHGADRAEGGWRADRYVDAIGCDDTGPVTVVGDLGQPTRLAAVLDLADHGGAALTSEEREVLRRWLELGAPAGQGVHESAFVDPRSTESHAAFLRRSRYAPLRDATHADVCARCHEGAGLPQWTTAAPGATACTTCHAEPEGVFACNTCHGSPATAAPPRASCFSPRSGEADAHAAHVQPSVSRAEGLACASCHPVPGGGGGSFDGAHADGHVEVWFDYAVAGRLATFDPTTGRCAGTCHDAGGARPQPAWNDAPMTCGDCHGAPPTGHYAGACNRCHAEANAEGTSLQSARLHMNGRVDRGDGSGTCGSCHGNGTSPWPATGAHAAHAQPSRGKPVPCETCHELPTATSSHPLGGAARVRLAGLALVSARRPSYDVATRTCAQTYCHDGAGAATPAPRWDDGPAASACGACHAAPPPPPHTASGTCSTNACHRGSTDAAGQLTPTGAQHHVDGRIDRSL